MRIPWLVAAALTISVVAPAAAETGCGDEVDADRFQYLRQLTLDLFGRVPTEDEARALVDKADVTPEDVKALMDAPEFETFLKRYHTDLFWPALEPGDLVNAAYSFLLPANFYGEDGDPTRLFALYPALYNRGGLVPCADVPAQYDDEGELIFEPWPDGTQREGYVLVEPYWAPGTEVKVCALEARIHPFTDAGLACDSAVGMATGYCGCGPDLRYCLSPDSAVEIVAALREQMLRIFIEPITEGRSYFDALTDETEPLNGPLIHYYRYLVPLAIDPIIQVPPVPPSALDEVPYSDKEWRRYARTPEHSGVLTSLSYLLRFMTGRARANHFYSTMLCQPFVAAADLELPSPNDACSDEPNLRERCGCAACHAVLEPASAYWARFAESGSLYMSPFSFPQFRQDCAECAATPGAPCDFICQRFYLTEAGHPKEEQWVGTLKSHVFRTDAELDNVQGGPRALVEQKLSEGQMSRCVVRRLYSRLHHKEMTSEESQTVLVELAERFESTGYDFKDLMFTLLTRPSYRRMLR